MSDDQKSLIQQLESYEGDSIEQILRDMLSDKNVGLKTEFINPVVVSKGRLMAEWCRIEKYERCAALWDAMIAYYERDMVSYKRASRTEIIGAVSAIVQRDAAFKDKVLGRGDEKR